MNALEPAARIRAGETTAEKVVEAALAAIERRNPVINCFIEVTAARAREEAKAVDRLRGQGGNLPPLAGVPYAVKNLLDVAGLPTIAGSALNTSAPPATADDVAVARMHAARAIPAGK